MLGIGVDRPALRRLFGHSPSRSSHLADWRLLHELCDSACQLAGRLRISGAYTLLDRSDLTGSFGIVSIAPAKTA